MIPIDQDKAASPPDQYEQFKQKRVRIFVSYKRDSDPDQQVALEVFQALREQHDVFIDQTMLVGTRWAERIENELRRSNFLISFLSYAAVNSEMVLAEIETAHRLGKMQSGYPIILPVRLAFRDPFQYPLSAYLNHINWAYWAGPEDTRHLINELRQAISGGELAISGARTKSELLTTPESSPLPRPSPVAQPITLEMPEGTMDPESRFYEERPTDAIALEAIKRQGVTITIKAPRQMGKSSLLIRTIAAAVEIGKRVAFLDFQLIDKTALANADLFFKQFCYWVTDSLEMDDEVDKHWSVPLGHSQRCTRYMSRYILKELGSPLVLAMDEVDSIFETDFRSDFFGMLRTWHNNRATSSIWKQLDLALVTSTEPYQLIANLNQSPFNVGEVIELADFTRAEVAALNRRHGLPLRPEEERQMMERLGGHPYLIRRALYLVTKNRITLQALLSHATDDRGPFGDHLRYHLFRLHNKPELIDGLRRVIRHNECIDDLIFFRLRGAGLVRKEGAKVLPRCELYSDYFREQLHV